MKIEPNRFEKILKMLSLYDAGKAYIDPIEISFSEDSITVAQMDQSYTTATIAKYPTTIFKDYETVGSKKLNTNLIKDLGKFFKVDDLVEINFTDDKIVITGKMERLEDGYPSIKVDKVRGNVVLKDWGYTTEKLEAVKGYKVEVAHFKDVSDDVITFEYGDTLKLIIEHDLKKYTRQIPIINSFGDSEGSRSLSGDLFNRVTANFEGQIWLVFTQEPIIFTWSSDNVIVTYIVAPVVR